MKLCGGILVEVGAGVVTITKDSCALGRPGETNVPVRGRATNEPVCCSGRGAGGGGGCWKEPGCGSMTNDPAGTNLDCARSASGAGPPPPPRKLLLAGRGGGPCLLDDADLSLALLLLLFLSLGGSPRACSGTWFKRNFVSDALRYPLSLEAFCCCGA
eukprot:CAMPEP_0178422866 /NCGR_PEP_ID=MMETSP0689_2-20121128/27396_1 /TAXON_ID=160604 /ORGANISM="Amphidinium massartii, Strain CS-259" /LENGTH=157 /DNA_ID=CAMNT_0020044447 /DNA_START=82 /DNA_END=555 /DNA_ORIENTATION=+